MSILFEENKAQEDHAQKSLRGGALSIAGRAINGVVQIGSVVCLARLLTPEDYGLVAMVSAITGFAPILVDLGTRDAVVQRESITEREVSALFWTTMLVGSVFALLVAGSGPLIARFYHEPRLTMIAMVSSLTFITSALTCQHHALLRRAMMFQQLVVVEVCANLLSAICAIALAFYGFAYWALVTRPIASALFLSIGVWSKAGWLPGRPEITQGVKDMLRFGIHLTGFCLADFVGRCADRVAIGYAQGARSLGFYQKGMLVYDNTLELTIGLHSVAVVSLSKLRDNLPELRRLWSKGLATVSFFAMPAFGVLAVVSPDLIVMLVGNKWAEAGVLLSVLALRGIPHVVERTLGWLHVAAGRADRWMRWGLLGTALQLVALFIGLPFGAMGVAIAYTICMFILFIPAIVYAGHPLGIGLPDLLRTIAPQLAGTLAAWGMGVFVRHTVLADWDRLERLIALSLIYGVSYLALTSGLFKVRTPLKVVVSLFKGFIPARFAPASD